MDSRIMWMFYINVVIGTIQCVRDERNMTECFNGGVQCSKWAKCVFDSVQSIFTCICVAGYTGHLCDEDRNECSIRLGPCKTRGICHNSIGSWRCDCFPGWQGSHCQTSDGSRSAPCPTGYTGLNCTDDLDECNEWTENPCEHNSTCNNIPGNLSCSCVTGWEGRICNEDVNECNLTSASCHNDRNCTNTPGGYTCVCPYPYTYPYTGPACEYTSVASVASSVPGSNTTINSASPYSTHSKVRQTEGNTSGSGNTNVGIIAGPIVGLLMIVGAVWAGIVVYKRFYRISQKINAADENEVEAKMQETTNGNSE